MFSFILHETGVSLSVQRSSHSLRLQHKGQSRNKLIYSVSVYYMYKLWARGLGIGFSVNLTSFSLCNQVF